MLAFTLNEKFILRESSSKEPFFGFCTQVNLVRYAQMQGTLIKANKVCVNRCKYCYAPRFVLLAQVAVKNCFLIATKDHKTAIINKSASPKWKGMRKYLVIPHIAAVQNCGFGTSKKGELKRVGCY